MSSAPAFFLQFAKCQNTSAKLHGVNYMGSALLRKNCDVLKQKKSCRSLQRISCNRSIHVLISVLEMNGSSFYSREKVVLLIAKKETPKHDRSKLEFTVFTMNPLQVILNFVEETTVHGVRYFGQASYVSRMTKLSLCHIKLYFIIL